ncbi:MAG: class I SAM-dependent methyltransferase [Anaerolineales bacterium]|nr:methyltransferase domain-containing protein [Anaerolineae bacterium]PWB51945.1 MAG: class I SAM-dependent methyltransferase [Anaerolineales bacterium]
MDPQSTDSAVQSFYDRHPYPRPLDNLDAYRRLWSDLNRQRADYHLYWPHRPFRDDFSILIAGCGTSQAAKYAMRWPHAHVVGIDFSQTSVQHTLVLKEKYALANLSVHQLPIQRVEELSLTFDQIVCTGVLHHLADPASGLNALSRVLAPDGAMQLMVYAPYGRAGIYMLQEFCRKLGIQVTDEGIHLLNQVLRVLPPGHPLEHLIQHAPDILNEVELADALLNPRDQAYSVSRLVDLLGEAGLKFGRWVRQAAYLAQCGLLASTQLASRITNLPMLEQYSAMELLRGTMLRHSAILYRKDASSSGRMINFRDPGWKSYVPIRIADTICVNERLPEGAAAVLINQVHSYTDLYMPIDAIEKHWYDAIDGKRTIRAVIEHSRAIQRETPKSDKVRSFFERLWWYDQVVFDLSNT